MELTNKTFWEKRWENQQPCQTNTLHPFHPIFKQFLTKGGSVIEIGCTPGTYLAYFSKFFHYYPAGIDYAGIDLTKKTLRNIGIENYELFELDFTKELPDKKYDVVSSFGFIEHFDEVDEIFLRHVALLNKNGILIIGIPHFKNFQYLLRRVYDKDILVVHNLEIMYPERLKELSIKYGAKKVLYCDYYGTFRFWIDNKTINPIVSKTVKYGNMAIQRILKAFRLDAIPNRLFSPYIILIAKF